MYRYPATICLQSMTLCLMFEGMEFHNVLVLRFKVKVTHMFERLLAYVNFIWYKCLLLLFNFLEPFFKTDLDH